MKNKYDTIVVGGGMAGLTSAVYQARADKKVLLIEKNDKCGGLVSSFTHNGFHFDAGLRAIEDAGVIFPLLKDLNIEMEVVKSPVSVGIEEDVIDIIDIDSLDDYRSLLNKYYPKMEKEIDDLIKVILKIMKHMEVLYGLENPAFKDLKRDRSYIFKQLLPWLPKFLFTVRKINRLNMPVEDYVESIVKDESLKDIITQHFFKKTPAFFAMSYFSLYLDYFYPKGGTGKLPEKIVRKLEEFNGEIMYNRSVTKVNALDSKVTDDQGNEYYYDDLIWAADLRAFYSLTDVAGLEQKYITEFEKVKSKVTQSRGGDSVFSIFLEVDEPLESFKEVAHGHFFYTPSKTGLSRTHWEELDNLLDNWDNIGKEEVLQWLDKFTELNTYEISVPGLKDDTLVPPGQSGVIISLLAEYDLFKKAKDSGWYDEFVEELETRILNVITKTIYPMLKDKILNSFSFSPLSIEGRVGSSQGAITGWTFKKPMPVVNKIQYSDKSVVTPIPSIYQAGQWAYSPAGVPMSILTGKLASDRILKKKK